MIQMVGKSQVWFYEFLFTLASLWRVGRALSEKSKQQCLWICFNTCHARFINISHEVCSDVRIPGVQDILILLKAFSFYRAYDIFHYCYNLERELGTNEWPKIKVSIGVLMWINHLFTAIQSNTIRGRRSLFMQVNFSIDYSNETTSCLLIKNIYMLHEMSLSSILHCWFNTPPKNNGL